jgi:hypothetical protein
MSLVISYVDFWFAFCLLCNFQYIILFLFLFLQKKKNQEFSKQTLSMKYHPVMAGAMLSRITIPAVSILLLGTSKIMFIL